VVRSAWFGLFGAIAVCGAIGCLFAVVVNNLGAHLIITGIALNVAAAAGTTLGLFFATGDKGMSGALKSGVLPNVKLPGIDAIPVLGTILSGHHILTYVALIAVPLVSMMMARTPFGLHIRAVGVDPKSAATAGIPVARVQMTALALSGICGGLAGLTCRWAM
jgi:simple sugar transport system permease protein